MGRDEDWILPAGQVAGAIAFCALLLSVLTNFPAWPNGATSLQAALAIIALTAFCRFAKYLFGLWRSRVEHPIGRIRDDFRPALIEYAPILVGFVTLGVFLYSITFLKSMIAAVVPFWADNLLAAIDRALLIDPNAIARSISPAIEPIGIFYGLWHGVHLGGILWVLHWQRAEKGRHILSFMLTWSMGMAVAYIFSSAGPIFTGRYDLALVPESMRQVVQFLWSNYKNGTAKLGAGISAFPSMHIAIATWFAIVLGSRGWKWVGIAYVAAMLFCSVVLGWHYAADGVAGIVIAIAADRIASAWLRNREVSITPLASSIAASN